jgi:hypothetical protein
MSHIMKPVKVIASVLGWVLFSAVLAIEIRDARNYHKSRELERQQERRRIEKENAQ